MSNSNNVRTSSQQKRMRELSVTPPSPEYIDSDSIFLSSQSLYGEVAANWRPYNAIEGDLTFVSEPELGHSAFHYPRLGNFISLFNKI